MLISFLSIRAPLQLAEELQKVAALSFTRKKKRKQNVWGNVALMFEAA